MIYLVTAQQQLFDNDVYKIIGVEESLRLLTPLLNVGLDTETTGLDPYTKELKLVQLGCFDFQIVIDCTTIDILRYKEYLESNRVFIGWNLKFDLKWLFKYKIVPQRVYDGYLAEKLMWLGYPAGFHSMSLKSAGITYLNVELDKTVRGQIIWKKDLTNEIVQYAANDVKYLEKIMEAQKVELQKKGLLTAIDYENRFVLPLSYCEFCGIKLDIEKWKIKMKKDQETLNNALSELNNWVVENFPNDIRYTYVNLQGDLFEGFNTDPQCKINWNSTKQVIPLFEELGFNLLVKDKSTGETKKSIDAKVIKPQKDLSSIAPIYLKYKAAQKVVSTYGENFLNQINPVSGRIHTNYQQLGADTTRITSGGKDKGAGIEYINFLNFPSNEETRACMVAEKGNKWISIDYAGQESALLASIANDPLMLKELNEGGGDIHSLVASLVFQEELKGVPLKDISKVSKENAHKGGVNYRQVAKGYEFLVAYGGDFNTIHANYGKSLEESKQIYDRYMNGLIGVQKYQAFCRKDVMEKGYILLNPLTGHKAYIYDFEDLQRIKAKFKEPGFWEYYREMKREAPECETVQMVKKYFKRKSASEKQSINYRIQGTGSMCLRVSLINFFKYLRDNNLLFKVLITVIPYDEINCEAPKEIADQIAKVLYNCMVKAGAYFCTRCKLDADISRLEDRTLPTYWIH